MMGFWDEFVSELKIANKRVVAATKKSQEEYKLERSKTLEEEKKQKKEEHDKGHLIDLDAKQ